MYFIFLAGLESSYFILSLPSFGTQHWGNITARDASGETLSCFLSFYVLNIKYAWFVDNYFMKD